MTIDEERFRAIENTREFLLRRLMDRSWQPKISELRELAYRLLRHYPEDYFIEDLKELWYRSEKGDWASTWTYSMRKSNKEVG